MDIHPASPVTMIGLRRVSMIGYPGHDMAVDNSIAG